MKNSRKATGASQRSLSDPSASHLQILRCLHVRGLVFRLLAIVVAGRHRHHRQCSQRPRRSLSVCFDADFHLFCSERLDDVLPFSVWVSACLSPSPWLSRGLSLFFWFWICLSLCRSVFSVLVALYLCLFLHVYIMSIRWSPICVGGKFVGLRLHACLCARSSVFLFVHMSIGLSISYNL